MRILKQSLLPSLNNLKPN